MRFEGIMVDSKYRKDKDGMVVCNAAIRGTLHWCADCGTVVSSNGDRCPVCDGRAITPLTEVIKRGMMVEVGVGEGMGWRMVISPQQW